MPHDVGFWGLFLTSLLRREVTVYLLNYLWHLVNPGTNALASVVEQDWWVVFAFHHICLCKSSHLCIKLSSSFMPFWKTCSWLTSQLNMTRMFTLLPGSSWTWGWCLCLLGGTEFLIMFQFSSKFAITGALFLMLMTALGSLPPVQDYSTGSVSWGGSRFLNLYLVRYLYFAHSYRFPTFYLLPGHWTT